MSKQSHTTSLPLGEARRGSISVGVLGAAGYTGGELIRLLLNHPQAEIVFANSESNAGNLVSDVHEGLMGDTDLRFTNEMPFDQVDVVFFCFGHGKSREFLQKHAIPSSVKIIDLAQDFRVTPPQPSQGEGEEGRLFPLLTITAPTIGLGRAFCRPFSANCMQRLMYFSSSNIYFSILNSQFPILLLLCDFVAKVLMFGKTN